MPFCPCENDEPIYYETTGEGPPLLLISGLGGGTWTWSGLIPDFAEHYRVITFDNRGAGKSAAPPGPYDVKGFAADALCILKHLGVERTFVLGLSMGGMIAQELALLDGRRVRALVLACTHCGGEARVPPAVEVVARLISNDGLTREEIIEKNIPLFLSEECRTGHPEVVDAYRRLQLEGPVQPEHAFHAQLRAIDAFDTCDRLADIMAPTLLITGTEDMLAPIENARYIAAHIPGAELVELQGAGHALHVESRKTLLELAHGFFSRYSI